MRYTYRFIEGERERTPHECDSCGCIAPLGDFKVNKSDGSMEQIFIELCEVCSSTYISNITRYNRVYSLEEQNITRSLAQVANLLLDKLTGRRKVLNESN